MKITVYLASSVNGMISQKSNVPDWLSQEYMDGFGAITEKTKAVIMGKTTYNILAPDYLPLKDEGTLVVLTHNTSATPAQSNVIFTDKNARAIATLLESRGHKEAVIIGGTQAVSEFLKTGLVDDVILTVEPFLFDGGLPLIKDTGDVKLILKEAKKVSDKTVQLHYSVVK